MDYKELRGSARIAFRGTVLLPRAEGVARVKRHEGGTSIQATFQHLEPAARFGPEYLTYVLWAVSPAGRATNLGEVAVRPNGRARLSATTNLQAFGLLVTAEPHFAVTSVSDLVVLDNTLDQRTRGRVEEVDTPFPLLPRGTYVLGSNPSELTAPRVDRRVSPYVHQARQAMALAREAQAARYAPDEFERAEATEARLELEKKQWKRPAVVLARQVVQLAEDARLVAVAKYQDLKAAEERKSAEEVRAQAEAARARAAQDALRARQQAAQEALQARHEAAREAGTVVKQQVRKKLSDQLGTLLQTQDTERGLIVRLSSLLFSTGRADLAPQAREKLSRVAGILLAYPGLTIKVEGHADSTGKTAFNQKLSEQRAARVRDYLIGQGISPQAVMAEGMGDQHPLEDNDTLAGRQKNRRVDLIVSGEPIGL
jgi:outer membrane protein OmpA-like peptidoglycan-associated protein